MPLRKIIAAVAAVPLLASCGILHSAHGARQTSPQSIVDITWQWEATLTPGSAVSVARPELYTLHLQPNGAAAVRFDCNRGGGSYKIAAGQLSFGPMMQTRMACPPGSLAGEFAGNLRKVVAFYVENDLLHLELNAGLGTMRLRRAP